MPMIMDWVSKLCTRHPTSRDGLTDSESAVATLAHQTEYSPLHHTQTTTRKIRTASTSSQSQMEPMWTWHSSLMTSIAVGILLNRTTLRSGMVIPGTLNWWGDGVGRMAVRYCKQHKTKWGSGKAMGKEANHKLSWLKCQLRLLPICRFSSNSYMSGRGFQIRYVDARDRGCAWMFRQ